MKRGTARQSDHCSGLRRFSAKIGLTNTFGWFAYAMKERAAFSGKPTRRQRLISRSKSGSRRKITLAPVNLPADEAAE